jgi:hypothetical protein
MAGDWDERAHGSAGLLVAKDLLNYVRLEKYRRLSFPGTVHIEATVAGEQKLFGRGQLRGNICCLRLERTGEGFAALCSTDGVQWLTCGHVILPVKGPLRVGVSTHTGLVVHYDYVQLLGRGDLPPR